VCPVQPAGPTPASASEAGEEHSSE
jgi:hypothetical protein